MGKRMKDYVAKMIKVSGEMAGGKLKQNKSEVLSEMLVQIGFFQHERLIHLIVTVLFAFLTIFTAACACFANTLYYGILYCVLCLLCLALLVPYIHHYYVLENGVQKLYEIYDSIRDGKKLN